MACNIWWSLRGAKVGSRNVIVTQGVVHLWGLVGSEDERHTLTALVEEYPA